MQLDVRHEAGFLSAEEKEELLAYLKSDAVSWNRVAYESRRFGTCTTPCYTTCQGGVEGEAHYEPMAPVVAKLRERLEAHLGARFNVVLLRLYYGSDEIAWHTDAREFLGSPCNVASISLGATRRFEMKRVAPDELWPEIGGGAGAGAGGEPKKKRPRSEAERAETHSWELKDGDLFVMQGDTQKHFYHRVPPMKSVKTPRFNLNFRLIIDSPAAKRGHATYYKYCVHGDDPKGYQGSSMRFSAIERKENGGMKSITSFFKQQKK